LVSFFRFSSVNAARVMAVFPSPHPANKAA
jgi:hypothetical protein